jgi:hypothetical protein
MWENPPKDRPSLIGSIKSAYEGTKLPGKVYSGETPIVGADGHTSDEVISGGLDLRRYWCLDQWPVAIKLMRGLAEGILDRSIEFGDLAGGATWPAGCNRVCCFITWV